MNRTGYLGKLAILSMLAFLTACDSSDTSDGGGSELDSGFVATEETVGSIELTVLRTPIPVGETGKFSVRVFDKFGSPVPHIRISCDSEQEVAIVEPTTGTELTDSWGHMSGEIGCEAAGSFQLACRLPIGGNLRSFANVKCEGAAPAGFAGWPNAAGGTLGGGVDTTDQEGQGAFGLRVTSIQFSDGPNENTTSIDAISNVCDPTATPVEVEFFTDTTVTFTVVNNSNQTVRFESYGYVVQNADGAGSNFTSDEINFIGEAPSISPQGGEGTFSAIFLDASAGGKRYFGSGGTIPESAFGFKNVRFTLFGTNANGEEVTATATTAISIDNFDNCS